MNQMMWIVMGVAAALTVGILAGTGVFQEQSAALAVEKPSMAGSEAAETANGDLEHCWESSSPSSVQSTCSYPYGTTWPGSEE